ncbi:MAG: DUF4097 family beta strand repeat protein [Clostridiales bacterium]|nr:DUF4097 family beta strand repeat protein [Candidatus Blautia equi]
MKKFSKWMLGIAAALVVLGLGLMIAGVTLGARFSEAAFLNNMGSRIFHIRDFSEVEEVILGDRPINDLFEHEEGDYEEYAGSMKTQSGSHHNGISTYEVSDMKNLEIDLKAGELRMKAYSGKEIQVKVDDENSKYVKVSSGDDFMKIESTRKVGGDEVTVYYPDNLKLEQLKIEVDAGEVDIMDEIAADYLEITIGAGEVNSKKKVTADTAVLQVGAGEISMKSIDAQKLTGDCGLGEMNLALTGSEKDYNYTLQCGLGSIKIGNNTHASIADREVIQNGSKKDIELSCGMGEIEIDFK